MHNKNIHTSNTDRSALDVLGQLLIERVRDLSIAQNDKVIFGEMKDLHSKEIHAGLLAHSVDPSALQDLIPTVVDTTIGFLLTLLDGEEVVDFVINLPGEAPIPAKSLSDGLGGELHAEDGWISKFSRQRIPYQDQIDDSASN
jgi:hypothetical protein